MDKMRAWLVIKPKQMELKNIPVPEPGADEVLVKTLAMCLCNGSDPGIYNGHEAYTPPFVFGHESSGIIVKKGCNVTGLEVGDWVFCWCAVGSFAEYQVLSQKNTALFKVPEGVTPEQSPILELVIASCRALMNRPASPDRKSITICGLGPSGLVLLQYAKLLGYERVIGWDLYESRRRLALELGADEVYDAARLNKDEKMPSSDISIDMMGDDTLPGEATFDLLLRATKVGGVIVSYGHPENGRRFSPYIFQSRNLTMTHPENDLAVIRRYGEDVLRFVEQGKIKVEPLITHRMRFDDIGQAFAHLLEKPEDQIKVIFTF